MKQRSGKRGLKGIGAGLAAVTLAAPTLAGCSSSSAEIGQLPPDLYGNKNAQDTLRSTANTLFDDYVTLAPESRSPILPSTAEPPTGITHKETYTGILPIQKGSGGYVIQATIDPTGLGPYSKTNNPHDMSSIYIAYFSNIAGKSIEPACEAAVSVSHVQLGGTAVWAYEVGPGAIEDGSLLGVSDTSSPSALDQQTQASLDAGLAKALFDGAKAGVAPNMPGC